MQDVELVRVHAWSCGAESGKEESMAVAITASAEVRVSGTEADGVADALIEAKTSIRVILRNVATLRLVTRMLV